jgi:ribosomal protein S18 acetylase RimI-like enzyme
MGEINIRRAAGSDIPYLYKICLETGASGKDATADFSDPWLIGQYYAAPYLFYPDALAFAAEEAALPQGYILSAPDSAAFYHWMETVWLHPLRVRYGKAFAEKSSTTSREKEIAWLINTDQHSMISPYETEYPAHLHIDLLPGLQGKGAGRRLINTLFDELRRRKVPGLHLGVAKDNEGAIAFYKKMNFSVLEEHQWGRTLGIKL